MQQDLWNSLFDSLRATREQICLWTPTEPEPATLRCAQSRHRTLAHLRACQEQWFWVARQFQERESPSVTILHPWRIFDQNDYSRCPWDEHLERFLADRETWLAWQDQLVPLSERGGKWNRKPDTIGGLTQRLAHHEAYHVELVRGKD